MRKVFDVRFDVRSIEAQLKTRFELGSPAQKAWDTIVFEGSVPYMPMETGTLINLSKMHTEFGSGELTYSGPYARYLWYGKIKVDPETGAAGFLTEDGWKSRRGVTKVLTNRDLKFSRAANPLAGPFWTQRAANDKMQIWENEMQGLINSGKV